jgi:hypothetical protein
MLLLLSAVELRIRNSLWYHPGTMCASRVFVFMATVLRIALLTGMLALPALSNIVVFSSLTSGCACGDASDGPTAAQFTSLSNYQLTDVEAYLVDEADPQATVDFSIYSDAGGLPGTQLTTLFGTLPATSQALVISGPPSVPLTLVSGTKYWLAIDIPADEGNWVWELNGSPSEPYSIYFTVFSTWEPSGINDYQFEINGTQSAPEPGTLALEGAGIALLVVARRRLWLT